MVGQLRHRHLGAQTVVEGDDRFAMAAHLEVGRVRQDVPRTGFEEQASGLTGVDEPRPKLLVLGGQRRIGVGATSPLPGANVSGITHGRAQPLTGRPCARAARSSIRGVLSRCRGTAEAPVGAIWPIPIWERRRRAERGPCMVTVHLLSMPLSPSVLTQTG
jgi:hypothetical protein